MIRAICRRAVGRLGDLLVSECKEMQETVQLSLSGEYDLTDKERLETLLSPAMAADSVILDMRDTTYLDSTALRCLLRLKQAMLARGGGSVKLLGLSNNLRRLFQIAGFDKLFEFVQNP